MKKLVRKEEVLVLEETKTNKTLNYGLIKI